MLYTHKNKTNCIICKTGMVEYDKFIHPDGTVELIRKQTNIKYVVFIPSPEKLEYYKALPQDTPLPHLRASSVDVVLEEKSQEFPSGIPTGLVYAELDPKFINKEPVVEEDKKTK